MAVLRIKPEHEESQGKFVLIDEENFDPKKHEMYVEMPPEPDKDTNTGDETGSDADKDPEPTNKTTKKSENK